MPCSEDDILHVLVHIYTFLYLNNPMKIVSCKHLKIIHTYYTKLFVV